LSRRNEKRRRIRRKREFGFFICDPKGQQQLPAERSDFPQSHDLFIVAGPDGHLHFSPDQLEGEMREPMAKEELFPHSETTIQLNKV
jgi:hypothetical protein